MDTVVAPSEDDKICCHIGGLSEAPSVATMPNTGAVADKLELFEELVGGVSHNLEVLRDVGNGLNHKLDELEQQYVDVLEEKEKLATQWCTEAFRIREMGTCNAIRLLAQNYATVGETLRSYRHTFQCWRLKWMLETDHLQRAKKIEAETVNRSMEQGLKFLKSICWRIICQDIQRLFTRWRSQMEEGQVVVRMPGGIRKRISYRAYRVVLDLFRIAPWDKRMPVATLVANWKRASNATVQFGGTGKGKLGFEDCVGSTGGRAAKLEEVMAGFKQWYGEVQKMDEEELNYTSDVFIEMFANMSGALQVFGF